MWRFNSIILFAMQLITCVYCDCVNPVEIWPLYPSTCASSTATVANMKTVCPVTFGEYDGVEDLIPMAFNGGEFSFLDLTVSTASAAIPEDFGLSVLVKLNSLDGTIFQYEANPSIVASSVEGTKSVQLSVQNGHLTLTRTFAQIPDVQVITETYFTLTTGTWYLVAFIYDVSMGKVEFFVDGADNTKIGTNIGDKYYLGPGTIRLGASFDTSAQKLNGFLSCVQLHPDKETEFSKSICLTKCRDIPNIWFPNRDYGTFVRVAENFEPTISYLNDGVATYDSWTKCSIECLRKYNNCISFTTETLSNGYLQCTMYDQILFSGLQLAPGKIYYMLLSY